MSDRDARLAEVLRTDAPPARDPIFRVETLARLERMRFRRRVVAAVVVATAAAVLAAVSAPVVDAWIAADIQRLFVVALGLAIALFGLSGVLVEALPGVRAVRRAYDRWLSS